MERAQLLRAFNEHFSEFVEDVLRVFPNDRELETVARALRALRSMNPRLILVVFRDRFSSPYRSQIESGDMGFFVDKDWKDDVKDSPGVGLNKSKVVDKINRMRSSVRDMGEADQAKALGYVQNLVRLADMYAGDE